MALGAMLSGIERSVSRESVLAPGLGESWTCPRLRHPDTQAKFERLALLPMIRVAVELSPMIR